MKIFNILRNIAGYSERRNNSNENLDEYRRLLKLPNQGRMSVEELSETPAYQLGLLPDYKKARMLFEGPTEEFSRDKLNRFTRGDIIYLFGNNIKRAKREDYLKWLIGHVQNGGFAKKSELKFPVEEFYIATSDFEMLPSYKEDLKIIVPKEINIFGEDFGRHQLFFMDGFKSSIYDPRIYTDLEKKVMKAVPNRARAPDGNYYLEQ